MSFQVYSDIHLELVNSFPKIPPRANYLILAGDIGDINKNNFQLFIRYCSVNWKHVFYVFGNHEFYVNRSMDTRKEEYTAFLASFENVHLLDNSSYELDGICIYGFIGWTPPIFETTQKARDELNDYHRIMMTKGKLTVPYMAELSSRELNLFREFVRTTNADKIMVISHFPPLRRGTSSPIFERSPLKNYFTWDNLASQLATDKIKVWCSGHTHWSYNFIEGGIRYISNQIGYREEHLDFGDGVFVVE